MTFSQWLIRRVTKPLPGREAHRRFVPNGKDADVRLAAAPVGARRSAVLIPIIEDVENGAEVVFTVRSESLRSHKGQISFPGGRLEAHETPIQAALRETEEEIGISRSNVHVIGTLSPLYIPPSNSAVTPVVAAVTRPSQWQLSVDEVTEVFTRPLMDFVDDTFYDERTDIIPQIPIPVPLWDVHPTIPLWGATAMMLHEVVLLYSHYLKDNP